MEVLAGLFLALLAHPGVLPLLSSAAVERGPQTLLEKGPVCAIT